MTKEKRLEIYQTLLSNMRYDENCGNYESKLRQEMKKMSIPEKMKFEVKRIDEASYGNKVVGNSFDAALYLVKKFNGVMLQKVYNNEVIHYYVAYLDEDEIVRVANPASDFINPKQNESEYRLDIPIENFRKNSLLNVEIGSSGRIIHNMNIDKFYVVNNNVTFHNYITLNGKDPTIGKLKKLGIEPTTITAYLACKKTTNVEDKKTK